MLVLFFSQGEEWASLRSILNRHLLQPMKLKHYYGGFSEVAIDTVETIRKLRDADGIMHDPLKETLERWAMECEYDFPENIHESH